MKRYFHGLLLFLFLFLLTCCTQPPIRLSRRVRSAATPAYRPAFDLLSQVVDVGPVYVTGDASVPRAALVEAGRILATMLAHRPDIGAVLRAHGVFTVVASRSERICDLPYFAHVSAYACAAYGQGGAGGTLSSPLTACSEKNLLGESDDPYGRDDRSPGSVSQNVCVHELAHTIMIGLSQADVARITDRYHAVEHTLWRGDYAGTNALEFWAVMSQFYFGAGPEHTYALEFYHIPNGADALRRYDPATWSLLDSIYRGSANLR